MVVNGSCDAAEHSEDRARVRSPPCRSCQFRRGREAGWPSTDDEYLSVCGRLVRALHSGSAPSCKSQTTRTLSAPNTIVNSYFKALATPSLQTSKRCGIGAPGTHRHRGACHHLPPDFLETHSHNRSAWTDVLALSPATMQGHPASRFPCDSWATLKPNERENCFLLVAIGWKKPSRSCFRSLADSIRMPIPLYQIGSKAIVFPFGHLSACLASIPKGFLTVHSFSGGLLLRRVPPRNGH